MKRDPLIEILKSEFSRKKSRNNAYSLRSYSRDLGIDPSNLSKILNRQKDVGPRLRSNLAKKLGFEISEVDSWLLPASFSKTRDKDYNPHNLEVFQIISGWQHYAILEILKVKDFEPTPRTISKCLELNIDVARESLNRLQKVGLLVVDPKTRRLVPAEMSSSSILNVATSKAHREQQRQILDGAIDALAETPIELRSQSSITMAIDSRKLDEARELVKKFRREMGRLLSASENLDEVYQLSVSLYPVSKIKMNQQTKEN